MKCWDCNWKWATTSSLEIYPVSELAIHIYNSSFYNATDLYIQNSVALVPEQTIPTERPPLVGEIVPTFADKGCRVVGATDSHGR
jgi:hypothetical protein